jgi:3-phosphoshikimate 1-carboxyvinyltransferase
MEMSLKITPGSLSGTINIPPSKSHTMRALLFGSLGKGTTVIEGALKSPDTYAMMKALTLFGAKIKLNDTEMCIEGLDGKLKPCDHCIDAGNSGQVFRFVGCLSALSSNYTLLTGDHSILYRRPMSAMLSALIQLGAFAISAHGDGRAPILVRGPLKAGNVKLNGEDSQPVSGLLMATSFLEGHTKIEVSNPGEKPWIDMTLFWLNKMGAGISHENYHTYHVPGSLSYEGFNWKIPGDWSSAAFPLVAALVTHSTLTLSNVDSEDVQGDKKIVSVLEQMGARFFKNPNGLTIYPAKTLRGITIDANDFIDAVPILAVLACFVEEATTITNVAIARQKESDRLTAISTELRKMGAQIEESEDRLTIIPSPLRGAILNTHQDHRIAMALAVAALGAQGISTLQNTSCIDKSYPGFATSFQNLGALICEVPC